MKLQDGRLIDINHVSYGLPRRVKNGLGGKRKG
jgi:hypothetical protein